jgi:alpha-D-glucose phosphate-specific phosphoglucomutase
MDDNAVSFGTDGWRAQADSFTMGRVRAVGGAVAAYLEDSAATGGVAVGYDARERSREAAVELAAVLAAGGREVTLAARDCPTPTLAWTVAEGPFAGGLMVTASHNPPGYNGVKFLTSEGAPALPAVTDALEQHLSAPRKTTDGEAGAVLDSEAVEQHDLREPYIEAVLDIVDTDLAGLTVAYDAMHGSGRAVTGTVLERAGASVQRRRCSRDPTFGGTAPEPGPDSAEALRARVTAGAGEAVSEGGGASAAADIGIINDGDADRVGCVTPRRGYLDANVLLAVLYEFLLSAFESGSVVRTVPTSSLVDRVASAAGETVHETQVGFKWVADAMLDTGALAGGEESGGYGLTRHLPNKDGVLVALLACAAHRDRPLDARIDDLLATHGTVEQGRHSVAVADDAKAGIAARLREDPPDTVAGAEVVEVSTVDGVKLVLADGAWLLVRPSGTEPKLRVYAEADDRERVDDLLAAGRELVE